MTECKCHEKGLVCGNCAASLDVPTHHYVYGSGIPGCLYDYGPNFATTKADAIDDLVCLFEQLLGKTSIARMKRDLEAHDIHYFDRRIRPFAGACYCEITKQSGPMPESED